MAPRVARALLESRGEERAIMTRRGEETVRALVGGVVATGLMALGYQQLFRRLGMWPNAVSGALVGLAQAILSMGFIAALPAVNLRSKEGGLKQMGPYAYGSLTIPTLVVGHVLYGAIVGWSIGRQGERASVVSPAFLRWLQKQEQADHVEQQPTPLRLRLRSVPPAQSRPSETPEWAMPARAA